MRELFIEIKQFLPDRLSTRNKLEIYCVWYHHQRINSPWLIHSNTLFESEIKRFAGKGYDTTRPICVDWGASDAGGYLNFCDVQDSSIYNLFRPNSRILFLKKQIVDEYGNIYF